MESVVESTQRSVAGPRAWQGGKYISIAIGSFVAHACTVKPRRAAFKIHRHFESHRQEDMHAGACTLRFGSGCLSMSRSVVKFVVWVCFLLFLA